MDKRHLERDGRIVIVGGGAGGLELASKLGRRLGRHKVVLVDHHSTHIWKPSLHEVAAGTLDANQEGLSYPVLAHDNGFSFVFGSFTALDTAKREITIAAFRDAGGETVIPERKLRYAALCIAVGSVSNYFNTPGAQEHCVSLNAPEDAERFRIEMLKRMLIAESLSQPATHSSMQSELSSGREKEEKAHVDVVIVGAGATGVELAAELREAGNAYVSYGFEHLDPVRDIRITLLEGGPRILGPLPERTAAMAADLLEQRHVKIVTGCKVAAIEPGRVTDAQGNFYAADLCVWAAGIRAPAFLAQLGLPVNKAGQLEVTPYLNVEGFSEIFSFGDCAACPMENGKLVPPRAQAAHQQADYLAAKLLARFRGRQEPGKPYVYRDYGSLVSIGTETGVGNLMGVLSGRWFIQGWLARLLYMSLHLLHHRAVLGSLRTAGLAIARLLIKRSTALVKLH